jgi:hypothetical protein
LTSTNCKDTTAVDGDAQNSSPTVIKELTDKINSLIEADLVNFEAAGANLNEGATKGKELSQGRRVYAVLN